MSTDRDGLEQLLAAYCHRVDRGTATEVAELFASDAVLRPVYDGDYECLGREEVQRWYAFYHETFRSTVRHLKHMITSCQFEINGDRASGCSYLLASAVGADDGEGFFVTGTYTDEYTRVTDDRWLFQSRRIEVETMAPQGVVQQEFPPLNFPPNP